MKILIVHNNSKVYGGAETAIVNLCNILAKTNDISLLTINAHEQMIKDLHGIILFNGTREMDMVHQLRSIYTKYDVINSHNHPSELYLDKPYKHVWYANEPGTSVLYNNIISNEERNLVQSLVTKIIVADEYNKQRIIRYYNIDPAIVPYGIDYEFFNKGGDPDKINDMYGLSKDDFVIVHPGWFNQFKNQLYTVELASRFNYDNVKFILNGHANDQYYDQVKQKVISKGLEKRVILDPVADRNKIRDIYSRANLVIFPYGSQGGFLSIFESLCLNKPIIVFPTVTCASMIKNNNLGVVTDNIYAELSNMYELYMINATPKLKNTSDWVKNNLTWYKYAKGVERVLQEVSQK